MLDGRLPFAGTGLLLSLLLALVPSAAAAEGQTDASAVLWQERVDVVSDMAYQGPWRMNYSNFFFVDDPTVAVNDQGEIGVAWVDQYQKDVFFQVYGPDARKRFETPVNVSRSPKIFSWLPRMVISSGNPERVYLLWQEIVFSGGSHGGEIFFARSTDGGRIFHDPMNLSNSVPGDGKGRLTSRFWDNGSLDLAEGPDGELYAVWTNYEGELLISRSTDGGQEFSKPRAIAERDESRPARGPSLAVAPDGIVHVAWAVGEDREADIRIASSSDTGQSFTAPRILFASDGHSDTPRIAVDSKGVVHLVYAESPGGPFHRYHVRYSRSADSAKTFVPPRDISSPLPEGFESGHYPALSLDARDNLYLLWELFRQGELRPQGLGFTVSVDAGHSFAPPTLVPGSADPHLGHNGSRQGLLMRKLAVNGAGAIAAVNSTFKEDEASHVWLFRGHQRGH